MISYKNRGVMLAVFLFAGMSWGFGGQAGGAKRHSTSSPDAVARERIVSYIRGRFNVPTTVRIEVGPFRPSDYSDFLVTTVSAGEGKDLKAQEFYISKDRKYLIAGTIFTLGADPRKDVEKTISTQHEPSQGPADAPVTIVEYADLQCPTCAHVHAFLENQVIPKYGNKIRIVFKEFPLVNFHDWTLTATLANECAFAINPSTFLPYRTLIFANQTSINATNARETLLRLGEEAGLDHLKLAECIDSKETLPRIEQNLKEGQQLSVVSTPTAFINGKPVIGLPSPDAYYQAIDQALAQAR